MISVVIPVFNEEPVLRRSLLAVLECLERLDLPDGFEVVCVDDGSADRSLEILRDVARDRPVEVLENSVNLGKGAAVRRGMLAARGDPTFFVDADLATPLDEIPRFLPLLVEGGADVAIGTRKHPEARVLKRQGPIRTFMGLGYTGLANRVLGLRHSDYTCGFKGFRRKAAEAIFQRSVVDGWSFDAEILFLANRLGLKIVEVPVTWHDQPQSKVRLLRDTARSFAELLAVRARAAAGVYDLPPAPLPAPAGEGESG